MYRLFTCPRRVGAISILTPLASRFLRFGRSSRFRSKRPLQRNRRDSGRAGAAVFGRRSIRRIRRFWPVFPLFAIAKMQVPRRHRQEDRRARGRQIVRAGARGNYFARFWPPKCPLRSGNFFFCVRAPHTREYLVFFAAPVLRDLTDSKIAAVEETGDRPAVTGRIALNTTLLHWSKAMSTATLPVSGTSLKSARRIARGQ